jgi:hypothetical protein
MFGQVVLRRSGICAVQAESLPVNRRSLDEKLPENSGSGKEVLDKKSPAVLLQQGKPKPYHNNSDNANLTDKFQSGNA